MSRWIYLAPVAIFAVIAFFLFRSLSSTPSTQLPSALIDKPAPRFTLPPLDAQAQGFGPRDLAAGHVTVVNVFASWCIPCRARGPVLMRLAARPGVTMFGMAWKDKPEAVRQFLNEVGNPFARIGLDMENRVGTEWGVYGAPETYVVDGRGIIRYKFVGPLTDRAVDRDLMPEIEKARLAL